MADSAMTGVRVALLVFAVAAGIGGYAIWHTRQVPDDTATASGTAEIVVEPAALAETSPVEPLEAKPDDAELAAAEIAAAESSTTEPEVTEPAAIDAAAEQTPAPTPLVENEVTPVAPTFDVVRIEADGAALIAGTAAADARVSLRLDGIEAVRVQAGGDGAFVAQFTMPPNPAPRLLSMVAILADGTEIAANETVAVAAIAATAPDVAVTQPAPPAAILLTEEGAEVVQGPAPIVVGEAVTVTLDAIAYAPDGAVQLSGRGQSDAALRIYLDNAPVLDAAVGADGKWAVTLPGTAPGLYTMRIDQMTADGKVGARFETPFKRETLEALAAASGVQESVENPLPHSAQSAPVTEVLAAPDTTVESLPQPDAVVPPDVSALPEAVADPIADAPAPEPEPAAVAAVEQATTAPEPASTEPVSVETVVADPVKAPVTVTVQPGFTLWGIATERFGEGKMYVQVFEANRSSIKDPDLIYPGQVFTLPQE